jgi:hypothetical protein
MLGPQGLLTVLQRFGSTYDFQYLSGNIPAGNSTSITEPRTRTTVAELVRSFSVASRIASLSVSLARTHACAGRFFSNR